MSPEEQAALDSEARAVEGEFIAAGEAAAAPGAEPEKPKLTTGQMATIMSRKGFDIFCPAWKVTDEECALFGEATGELVDKYIPDLDLGPEVTFVIVALAVFGSRAGMPRKVEPKEEKEDASAG